MKKLSFCAALFGTMFALNSNAQTQDEEAVTVTMDLQPILQLEMETPNQLEFVFDEISEYIGGITQYAATSLKVSSTVRWDLYAVGRSGDGDIWDNHATYGSTPSALSLPIVPLGALELHQNQVNGSTGGALDYSLPFAPVTAPTGDNSVFYGVSGAVPAATNRYIAGNTGTGLADSRAGGSYLTNTTGDAFYYTIDYRIVPGIQSNFPMAFDNAGGSSATDAITAGQYASPGIYSMYVQYILTEDQ